MGVEIEDDDSKVPALLCVSSLCVSVRGSADLKSRVGRV